MNSEQFETFCSGYLEETPLPEPLSDDDLEWLLKMYNGNEKQSIQFSELRDLLLTYMIEAPQGYWSFKNAPNRKRGVKVYPKPPGGHTIGDTKINADGVHIDTEI